MAISAVCLYTTDLKAVCLRNSWFGRRAEFGGEAAGGLGGFREPRDLHVAVDLHARTTKFACELGYAATQMCVASMPLLVSAALFKLNRAGSNAIQRLDLFPQPIELADLFGAL